MAGYPPTCSSNPEIECTRGTKNAVNIAKLFFRMIPTILIFIIILSGLIILSHTVYNQRKNINKYTFQSSRQNNHDDFGNSTYINHSCDHNVTSSLQSNSGTNFERVRSSLQSNSGTTTTNGEHTERRKIKRKKSIIEKQEKKVQIQCLLYAITFTNSILWEVAYTILTLVGNATNNSNLTAKNSWIPIIIVVFLPLQGFWNFIIFIRPRYYDTREKYQQSGRLFAFLNAIWNPNLIDNRSVRGDKSSSKFGHPSSSKLSIPSSSGGRNPSRDGTSKVDETTTTPVQVEGELKTKNSKNLKVSFSTDEGKLSISSSNLNEEENVVGEEAVEEEVVVDEVDALDRGCD